MKYIETKKGKLTIGLSVFIAVFIVSMIDAYRDNYKKDQIAINQIEAIIEENCNCKEVTLDMYSQGIQFDKSGNFSTESVEYVLKNCQYESVELEAKKINYLLNKEVKDYAKFDHVELTFISDQKHETVIINNGKIKS